MFRAAYFAVGSVLFILVAGLLLWMVFEIPAATQLIVSKSMAPGCVRPKLDEIPPNAGTLTSATVRGNDSGSALRQQSVSDWSAATSASTGLGQPSSRDLVVYVHGFNTSPAEATCVGENLLSDLAQLPQYLHQGPDVLVFLWPSEFGLSDFSQAQHNASLSAQYLLSIIGPVAGRKRYLVAHSLGSKVLMDCLAGMQGQLQPISGVLLVAGAIPAVSVREWSSSKTTRFPAAESLGRLGESRPIEERTEGVGEYVAAAARADQFVVTVSSGDSVLGRIFSLGRISEDYRKKGPLIPPVEGELPGQQAQDLAIGSPFPPSPLFRSFDQLLPDPVGDTNRRRDPVPRLQTDPSRVMSSTVLRFDFKVPHPSYHELVLSDIRWRPLTYWHAPLNDPAMRREILARAWTHFGSNTGGKPTRN